MLVLIVGAAITLPRMEDKVGYVKETVTVTEEVTPDWASDPEAVQAAQDVIKKKELEAEEARLVDEITSKQDELDAIRKELGSYWKDKRNVVSLIRETFPEDPNTAIAVARCESGLNANAYNPTNSNGTTDGGLWQINDVHNSTLERMGLDKYNPEDATEFARYLYDQRGWKDWVCYTKNMHVAML